MSCKRIGSLYELKNPIANISEWNLYPPIQIGSWSLNYSVLSYCYSVLTSSSVSDELKALAQCVAWMWNNYQETAGSETP